MKKISTLDGLRGIAILLVLWIHIPQIGNNLIGTFFKSLSEIVNTGLLGVTIFFVLSGFLITRILIKNKVQGKLSIKEFYIKRSLRIFPIYYLSIIVFGAIISWDKLWPVATYTSNFFIAFNEVPKFMDHSWSLCVEEHFYLIWPFILYRFSLKKSERILKYIIPIFSISAAIITYLILPSALAYKVVYYGTPYNIIALSLGSYIAFKEDAIHKLSKKSLVLISSFIPIILFCVIVGKLIPGIKSIPPFGSQFVPYNILAGFVVVICIRAESSKSLLKKFLTNKVLMFIGSISYGLYLYHLPILYLNGMYLSKKPIDASKAFEIIALIFGIAIISYFVIEKPILKLKTKLINKTSSIPSSTEVTALL